MYENLYHIVVEGKLLIIVLYVDDLILTSEDQLIKYYKEDLAREFEMKDIGLMHYFLGMEVWKGDGEWFMSQGKYANEILRRFCIERSKPMETPLAEGVRLQGFTDADWVGSPSDWKITSRRIFIIGSMTVSWYNRKHRSFALNSTEVEYMTASQETCEAMWMSKIMVFLFG
eukprot:PITA_29322